MKQKVEIVQDTEGNRIVVIHDIRFRGKRKINWREVEKFLKEYVGKCYEIAESAEKIYIGREFPDEFAGSKDTARLKGTLAKAKANAAQGVGELLEIASSERYVINKEQKHMWNAKYGWYRYHSRFALPVFAENGKIERYNMFCAQMIIRHDADGKKYLYDVINLKKEPSTPLCLMRTV